MFDGLGLCLVPISLSLRVPQKQSISTFSFWNEVISFNELVPVFKVIFYVTEKWKEQVQEKEGQSVKVSQR